MISHVPTDLRCHFKEHMSSLFRSWNLLLGFPIRSIGVSIHHQNVTVFCHGVFLVTVFYPEVRTHLTTILSQNSFEGASMFVTVGGNLGRHMFVEGNLLMSMKTTKAQTFGWIQSL
jgi:hypothetical protein